MKKFNLASILFLMGTFILIQGCGNNEVDKAVILNNKIVDGKDSIPVLFKKFDDKIKSVLNSEKPIFKELDSPIMEIENFLKVKISSLKSLGEMEGAEEFIQSMLDYYEFQFKELEYMKAIRDLPIKDYEKKFLSLIDTIKLHAEKEKDLIKKQEESQGEFSRRYGFELVD